MCQRYVLPEQSVAEREFVPAAAWWKFTPRFNVSAGQYVPTIRMHDAQTEGVMMRWGLIPSWVEGTPDGRRRTSVHVTRIEASKSTKTAWDGGRRCILAMAGFYCWQLTEVGHRQPFYVRLEERSVFGVAAIWDRWTSEDDDVIESCSLVSVSANELLAQVAGAAGGMPAILRRKDYAAWLQGSAAEAMAALQPYKASWMHAYPVSPRINSLAVDDPTLIRMAG
jgi:putative SOS response-associated peptidase YedK